MTKKNTTQQPTEIAETRLKVRISFIVVYFSEEMSHSNKTRRHTLPFGELHQRVIFFKVFKQKLVNCFWMAGQMLFEMTGLSTWVLALRALEWFFSGVNAEVPFQFACFGEWLPALFTVMWLLSTVSEQMSGKVWFCDRREVAPFALVWFF